MCLFSVYICIYVNSTLPVVCDEQRTNQSLLYCRSGRCKYDAYTTSEHSAFPRFAFCNIFYHTIKKVTCNAMKRNLDILWDVINVHIVCHRSSQKERKKRNGDSKTRREGEGRQEEDKEKGRGREKKREKQKRRRRNEKGKVRTLFSYFLIIYYILSWQQNDSCVFFITKRGTRTKKGGTRATKKGGRTKANKRGV